MDLSNRAVAAAVAETVAALRQTEASAPTDTSRADRSVGPEAGGQASTPAPATEAASMLTTWPPADFLASVALAERALAAARASDTPRQSAVATPRDMAPAMSSSLRPEELPQRVAAVQALHQDFELALAQAAAQASKDGPGWVRAWEPTPGEPAGGGQWVLRFSPATFRDAYLSQGGAALQSVARAYGARSVEALLSARPELRWTALDTTATAAPALNGEGAPPTWTSQTLPASQPLGADGRTPAWIAQADDAARTHWQQTVDAAAPGTYAQAPAEELRAIDQVLSTSVAREILASFEGPPRALSDLDPATVARFGVNRARAMDMMARANRAIETQGEAGASTPVFKGEPPADRAWLARRAELAQQVATEFRTAHPGILEERPDLLNIVSIYQDFANTSPALQALAQHLGYADSAALLRADSHPDLVHMADPAWTGGILPIGQAAASAEELGSIDLMLSDPVNLELMQALGGPPQAPQGEVARALVQRYGLSRYQAMTQLSVAMNAMRQDYLQRLNNARTDAADPAARGQLPTEFLGADGKFSVDGFTQWYLAQDGAANRAFAQLMGPSHTQTVTYQGEGGDENVTTTRFEISGMSFEQEPMAKPDSPYTRWVWMDPASGQAGGLRGIDAQSPPDLRSQEAIGFHPLLGWVVDRSNIDNHSNPWLGVVVKAVIAVGVGYAASVVGAAAAGAGGGTAAGASAAIADGGLSVGQAIAAGAAAGAAGAAVGAAMDGETPFRWKDVLKGAFTGGLSAGLAAELGRIKDVSDFAKQNAVAYQALLSGGTQALLGESFKQGLLSGFVGGVASQVDLGLVNFIKGRATLSAAEKAAAITFAHALSSAMRIAADPSNPSAAFASAFLDSVLRDPDLKALAAQAQGSASAPTPAPPPSASDGSAAPVAPSDDPKDPAYWSRWLGDDPNVADLPPDAMLAGGDATLALEQLFNVSAENLDAFKQALAGRALSGRLASMLRILGWGTTLGIGLALLTVPGNAGKEASAVMLDGSSDRRLVVANGAVYGHVEYLTPAGDWLAEAGPERMAVRVGDRWQAMTSAEYAASFSHPSTPAPAPVVAAPAPAPTPTPAPTPASPVPPPATLPSGGSTGGGAAPRPPGTAAPTPAPAPAPPTPTPTPTPTPAPVTSPSAPAAPAVGYVPEPVDTSLPGYGEGTPPLPDTTLPSYPSLPPGSVVPPLTGSPVVVPPPSGPPPSGSTTPVETPTLIWTPPAGMSVADYLILAERNNWPIPRDVHASLTRPQGAAGGQPTGLPEDPSDGGKQAENRTAKILAEAGYRVRQGPAENEEQRAASGLSEAMQEQLGLSRRGRPDYLIEGRVFDCYAPTSSDVRSVVDHMLQKNNNGQANRLVVNLDEGTNLSIRDIKAELATRADRADLHEIIFIEHGRIVHVLPNQM